jgi:histidinol-phosphate aminotransferase
MEHLVRSCYKTGGYVYARSASDLSAKYGLPRIARLASNENPKPPSPSAVARGSAALSEANRYPDETTRDLVDALKAAHGDYHFVTGVGMDGVIETLVRVLVDPGDLVVVSSPTFSFYRLAALAHAADVRLSPRGEDFSIDPASFSRDTRGAKCAFLCSPNNPTGNATPPDVIDEIAGSMDGVLFLDNAYVEFSSYDYLPLLKKHENLVIGRTFSKAYSLAGLRIGYAMVPAWLEPFYNRAATPHTLNRVSSSAAAGALTDTDHLMETVSHTRKWRQYIMDTCRYPHVISDANFVLFDVSPMTGDEMTGLLAKRGVIVRSCASFTGMANHYIRVSIGDAWENELFVREINAL